MKNIKKTIIIFSLIFLPYLCLAEGGFNFVGDSGLSAMAEKTGHAGNIGMFGTLNSPDSIDDDISHSIGTLIYYILSFVGVIFLALLIYGGVLWMVARGNDDQVKKAKSIITQSIIGLAVTVSAYSVSILITRVFGFQ